MFKLFQSFFERGSGRASAYPEAAIQEAIERAVDATDPRLRALGGYRKRLREPVLHAAEHVIAMVDALPAPIPATVENYRDDARLGAMFSSPQRMLKLLGDDRAVGAALQAAPDRGAPLFALLVMDISEKRTLGMALEDDMIKRDVQQTVVSFDAHRVLDPCPDIEETRRALKRRAFDNILGQVLESMGTRRTARQELSSQREFLARKRKLMSEAGWSFEADGAAPADLAKIEDKLAQIEAKLAELGADAETLTIHLGMLADALTAADKYLWMKPRELILDHANVLHDHADPMSRPLALQELHDARGARAVTVMLEIEPALLEKTDFFAATKHYLR